MALEDQPLALDYFSAGVPPGLTLGAALDDLGRLLAHAQQPISRLDPAAQICLIALIAYSEAFFKEHFAALLNIAPRLLDNLQRKGRETSVDARYLFSGEAPLRQIGFLIAEKYDLGTSRKINGIYMDAMGVTPFSKTDARRYDELLQDRNLLVHHGGVFTTAYARQRLGTDVGVFRDSLIFSRDDFTAASDFIWTQAEKTMSSTQRALREMFEVTGTKPDAEQNRAIDYLTYHMRG